MSILKLKPSCKDYLWGGSRLKKEYGKEFEGDVLAETWELSCHPDGPSFIQNGEYAGKTLPQYIEAEGKAVLGVHCRRFRDFPILIKFIDAKDNLSVQVHPDNRYALKHEGQYGKTEMWYVLDAEEDAFLYYGFQREISKEEFKKRIDDDSLLEVLNAVPVQKGDVLFIESGTLHAIGKGILIAEIQQNSNVTYRVYDYGRMGKDGRKRDLHIEKALAVTNRIPVIRSHSSYPHVADCDYFTVDRLNLDGKVMKRMEGTVSEESFASILILDGNGTVSCGGETLDFQKGDSFFAAAGSGQYTIEGTCDALITTIREKTAPVRVGIEVSKTDDGGTCTRIGLVDIHQKIIACREMRMDASFKAEDVICRIGEKTLELLDDQGIAIDQCIGAGAGVPGTVDRKRGIVCYSNSIQWKNVRFSEELEKVLPFPVKVANNGDCAVLGEAAAGAGRAYRDIIMMTVGTGVGGGIILDGRLYEGKGMGGSEIGHTVIVENGEPCSCGRRGCLEAYVSVAALVRNAKNVTGKTLRPLEIFQGAEAGDERLRMITDRYLCSLGNGIVNMINIFRPQLLLIGGELSALGDFITKPLNDMVRKLCFGGENGEVPEIETAALGSDAGIIGSADLV